jgi:UDP-2-acetamido-2,6-beta-L-arabino-hexul-4-ose reductase
MRFAVTGSEGFLGWHLRCALKAHGYEFVAVNRDTTSDLPHLADTLAGVDVVFHLAAVNRAESAMVIAQNTDLARTLTDALDRSASRPYIVYANSIQAGNGTPFGDAKLAAGEHLAAWGTRQGSSVADVRLPNLFGEHGRPDYNSVVATFCHRLTNDEQPMVVEDRELPLLHVQDAVDELLVLTGRRHNGAIWPQGSPVSVSALLELLTRYRDSYSVGDIPDIETPLQQALFNTMRSYTFPQRFPIIPRARTTRGVPQFDCARSGLTRSRVTCQTLDPLGVDGDRFHRRRFVRLVVLHGRARIAVRRLFEPDAVTFDVSADRPAIIDVPTMWAYSATNLEDSEALILTWTDTVDDDSADCYPEKVVVR